MMARFNRIETVLKMEESGFVPVFYHSGLEFCKRVLLASYNGGARAFEFTNRGERAHEIFRELTIFSAENTPDMILGVGSIVEPATAGLYIQLGANFIVSPIVNEEVARTCNRRKVAWVPGCGTVSEISYAEELGAEIVKVFPASEVGGPSFIKAVRGPMPWTRIMPTGGVDTTRENLESWFSAGASCVGIGSTLFNEVINNQDFEMFQNKVKSVADIIELIRRN